MVNEWLRNQLISARLEPVPRKSCVASYYRQFPMNIKIKITKLIPVLFGDNIYLSHHILGSFPKILK